MLTRLACSFRHHAWGPMDTPHRDNQYVNGMFRTVNILRQRHCLHCFSVQTLQPAENIFRFEDADKLTWVVKTTTHEPFPRESK